MNFVYSSNVFTPLGQLSMFELDGSLVALSSGPKLFAQRVEHLRRCLEEMVIRPREPSALTEECGRQIEQYLEGRRREFDLPLSLLASPFQRTVLQAVSAVPYGATATYKEIGLAIGSCGYRAIGTAISRNPLPLLIPCHRIINIDGSPGNYSFLSGAPAKLVLLQTEGIAVPAGQL